MSPAPPRTASNHRASNLRTATLPFCRLLLVLSWLWLCQPLSALWVCSYNLHNWLSQTQRGSALPLTKPEREKQVAVRLLVSLHPDVLCVSEIGAESEVDDLQLRLKTAGLDLPHRHAVGGSDPMRRLAVLSRLPLTAQPPAAELSYRLDGRTMSVQRGFLDVEVLVSKNFSFRLMAAHLKSMREVEDGDQDLMRRHEARLLRKHLDASLQPSNSTRLLCVGDLNDHLNSPTLRTLIGRGGSHPLWLLNPVDQRGEGWTHYWRAAGVYSRLDYALASPTLKPLIKGCHIPDDREWMEASDHRPLLIEIQEPNSSGADP